MSLQFAEIGRLFAGGGNSGCNPASHVGQLLQYTSFVNMAKNDIILLDGIVDQRLLQELPSRDRGEVFEYLVLEELLKDYDLSRDELDAGWIDGRNDGGVDGFYIFINGHLLEDDGDFQWPRANASIDVWLITCKHHATFQQAPLDCLLATIQEVFDLSIAIDELHGSYSNELIELRSLFHLAYRRLSIGRPILRFQIAYASRGDSSDVGESVESRSRQIEGIMSGLFSSCSVKFYFTGAMELVALHRKTKTFSLNLPFLEHLATGKDSYVLLVRLEDYRQFVTDENGSLRRYLFDSNVRDFLGSKGVNDDIASSLADETAPDFWWLNNGVTILSTNATVPGKTIELQDIQIVNGLQTTETIFRHFNEGTTLSRERALLVKIIVSSDAHVRDRIIRATNNQSPVEIAALHATDKIQRDIEEILERHNWYYERRRNYYRNIGKPQTRLVTPIYLASAMVALVLRNASNATRLKPKFMRTQHGYERVFSSKVPISVWPIIVEVYKCVDICLSDVAMTRKRGERFLSNWRPLTSLILVAMIIGKFSYSVTELVLIDLTRVTTDNALAAWCVIDDVQKTWELLPEGKRPNRPRMSFFSACFDEAAKRYGIDGRESLSNPEGGSVDAEVLPEESLTPEFVNEVNAVLPEQPWKPGMHYEVASNLGHKARRVKAAIQQLIAEGRRYAQRDGVVYGLDGSVLMWDRERSGQL